MNNDAQMAMSSLATQVGSISAFFGGVAVAFLGLLIFTSMRSRLVEFTIAAFVIAAVCFIVSALAATVLGVGILPGADQSIATRNYLATAQLLMNVCFLLGSVGLLSGIAISGWLRSPSTGYLTTSMGGVGMAAMLWLSIRVG